MSFNARLTQVIDNQFGGNKTKFSKETGIPYTSVVEFANGIKTDPKLSFLIKVLKVIGYENILWLLEGEGQLTNKGLSTQMVGQMMNEDLKTNKVEQQKLEAMIDQLKINLDERGKMIKVQDELIESLKRNKG